MMNTTNIKPKEKEYLLNAMTSLLTEYDHTFRTGALNRIIDKWAFEKRELIEAFKKHPNYLEGKFMIVFDVDYERAIDLNAIIYFSNWLDDISDELRYDIPETIIKKREKEGCRCLPHKLSVFLTSLYDFAETKITDFVADYLADAIPEVRVHKGEKTSRVVNKICKYLGYDKHPNYNKEFAKYADAISPITIKRHTILSVNPLDYLTMSFGNSWSSCHTIDKRNKRNMPNSYDGQCCSGTISYMLDSCSMVLYTVDAAYNENEYWDQPKINRQMFHWGEDKLVQGRLYPQGNDGSQSAYEPYRQIVQKIMSMIFDFPNLWTFKKGSHPIEQVVITRGTHYADYMHYDTCTISRVQGNKNNRNFIIGAEPICIECGGVHIRGRNINCCVYKPYKCENCGRHIDEEEQTIVDGIRYCVDCVPSDTVESES